MQDSLRVREMAQIPFGSLVEDHRRDGDDRLGQGMVVRISRASRALHTPQ